MPVKHKSFNLRLGVFFVWGVVAAGLVLSLVLLFDGRGDRATDGVAKPSRTWTDQYFFPIAWLVSEPLHLVQGAIQEAQLWIDAVQENKRLKLELARLKKDHDTLVMLKSLKQRYESLLKIRTDPPVPMIAARVVLDAHGPFSRSRLANAGAGDGVKIGNPVLSEHGVLGRIVGVTSPSSAIQASRILLLTDMESRAPVFVSTNNARAMLVGDGSDRPRLEYIQGHSSIQPGQILLTSGDGGLYPRGLPVGVVERDVVGKLRVHLYAEDYPIDYVEIMQYVDFSALVDQTALNRHELPPVSSNTRDEMNAVLAAKAASVKLSQPASSAKGQPLLSPR